MKEIKGNLWDYYGRPRTIILITTNNYVKSNGQAVMGRGCALEAKKRFPGIAKKLGTRLKQSKGIHQLEEGVWSFPVKHSWEQPADLTLIKASAEQLGWIAKGCPSSTYILPRPGCGNGRLLWMEVRPIIEPLLPDNVWVIDFAK